MSADVESTRQLPFLTTEEVRERYGFDPYPFLERHEAGGNFIFNKLVSTKTGQLVRVWLEREVAAHPSAQKGA